MSSLEYQGQIVIAATLDTKGAEATYLKERLLAAEAAPLLVDVGVLGTPRCEPDVGRDEIARLGGSSIERLAKQQDRGSAIAVMQRGFEAWVRERHVRQPLAGILGIGGSAGTTGPRR